jgi:plasmid stabilization system protein ParE
MNVIYSPRAVRDIEKIGAYYKYVADPRIAAALADRIEYVINRLAREPYSAPNVVDRPGVRAMLVLRYARIFGHG